MLRARPPGGTIRRRYSLVVSVVYILIGLVIAARSIAAHVPAIGLLGLVFIALGAVRIRDYLAWRRTFHDS